MAAVDKVYMPDLSLFEDPRSFYGVWAHELAHATKAHYRLNRSYGDAQFGNEEQRGGQTFSIIPFVDNGEREQGEGGGLSLVA